MLWTATSSLCLVQVLSEWEINTQDTSINIIRKTPEKRSESITNKPEWEINTQDGKRGVGNQRVILYSPEKQQECINKHGDLPYSSPLLEVPWLALEVLAAAAAAAAATAAVRGVAVDGVSGSYALSVLGGRPVHACMGQISSAGFKRAKRRLQMGNNT